LQDPNSEKCLRRKYFQTQKLEEAILRNFQHHHGAFISACSSVFGNIFCESMPKANNVFSSTEKMPNFISFWTTANEPSLCCHINVKE
jgi:hypothetical protein